MIVLSRNLCYRYHRTVVLLNDELRGVLGLENLDERFQTGVVRLFGSGHDDVGIRRILAFAEQELCRVKTRLNDLVGVVDVYVELADVRVDLIAVELGDLYGLYELS